MGNVRKALHICRGSFKRELVSPRIYIAFLWFLFLIYFIVSVIRSFGVSVGLRTSPWLLPLLTQQSGNQMFIYHWGSVDFLRRSVPARKQRMADPAGREKKLVLGEHALHLGNVPVLCTGTGYYPHHSSDPSCGDDKQLGTGIRISGPD